MNNKIRNVRIIAINNGILDGFNIYLDFSGQREFLMHHRHNGLLYALLKDGIRADELRRWSPAVGRGSRGRAATDQLKGMVSHLLLVVDDYIRERGADRAALAATLATAEIRNNACAA